MVSHGGPAPYRRATTDVGGAGGSMTRWITIVSAGPGDTMRSFRIAC